jgi:hypothetical protein
MKGPAPVQGYTTLLDFGRQPICNRFLYSPEEAEARFPLALALEHFSGLLRLREPIPAPELRPRVDWINYNEPEEHLVDALPRIITAASLQPEARILGLSRYDRSMIEAFSSLGFADGRILDAAADLSIPAGGGTESVQARLRPDIATALRNKLGSFDVIVARYILEHVQDLPAFCSSLRMLLNDHGLILFEVPDFTPSLEAGEYCNIWEEHSTYFTPASLRNFFADQDFDIMTEQMYPYPLENSLVILVKPSGAPVLRPPAPQVQGEDARSFAARFPGRKRQVRAALERLRSEAPIAMLGAGHLGIKFINFMEIADLISFVVDDHPKKCGLFLPGSRLAIKPSRSLLDESIGYCLLSVRPEREEAALLNLDTFLTQGRAAYSIFASSRRSLPL